MSGAVLFIAASALIEGSPAATPLRFAPGVFAALGAAARRGYRLVLLDAPAALQDYLLDTFGAQGAPFAAALACGHGVPGGCDCRATLLPGYLSEHSLEPAACALIGMTHAAAPQTLRRLAAAPGGAPDWPATLRELTGRRASLARYTRETRIEGTLDLEAEAPVQVATGLAFFDHMLSQLASHGGFALELRCAGDLQIDEHHTVEDCALALGQALRQALGDKRGIARYGFVLPMDESVACVALDLSGRPWAQFAGCFGRERVGDLPTELVPHFFASFAQGLGAALHVAVSGANTHHMIEACFKGVGRALRQALRREGEVLPSTKGVL